MTRLDHHIANVRNKLALSIFLSAWAWTALGVAAVFWFIIIGERVLDRTLTHWTAIFWGGVGASALAALIYSLVRRPTVGLAAVAIDDELGLKEKFSTALYARAVADPFAQAAVLDAEQTAQNVSLSNRFPLKFPPLALTAGAVFLAAFLTAVFMPPLHLFASAPPVAMKPPVVAVDPVRSALVKKELPKIEEGAKIASDNTALKKAADDLENALKTREGDDLTAKRSALVALQDYKKAITDELDKNQQFQTAMDEKSAMSEMSKAADDSTPMGKAQNELRSGDIESAIKDMNKAVNNLDKMSAADQKKTVEAAKQLAQDLAKAANDPKTEQKIEQQLQQMGASQQQAQQMAQTMQQAAQGNAQAQQQLQKMAQQMQQQMNNGQGPTQQQQKQIQQMMAQAQGLANSQAQGQAMSGAAQQLAQAMAQAQQASAQAGQGTSGAPGQQAGAGAQGMSSAQQNMQQQMQRMEAMARDAQAMQAARDAAQQAAQDAADGLGNGNGQGSGDGLADGNNVPPDHADQSNQEKGKGMGGGGGGPGEGGGQMGIVYAPGQTHQVVDASADNPNGKMLASRYVKAPNDPGQSTAVAQNVAASADKDATDEVDDDHVSREAQQSVKQYFTAMDQEDQH